MVYRHRFVSAGRAGDAGEARSSLPSDGTGKPLAEIAASARACRFALFLQRHEVRDVIAEKNK